MPGSSVGKALVSHTGVQGSIPTSDMQSFFNKYLQMQLLISLSRNLSCSNVEYSKSASVDCMHPLFSKNQSQLSSFKYRIMLALHFSTIWVAQLIECWPSDLETGVQSPPLARKSFSGKIFLICFLKSVFHPTFPNSKKRRQLLHVYIKELFYIGLVRSRTDTRFMFYKGHVIRDTSQISRKFKGQGLSSSGKLRDTYYRNCCTKNIFKT